jgi:hypothetical protein
MTVRSGLNEEEANPGGQNAPDSAGGARAGSVSARVDDVLQAAERAAAAIRQEASEWANKHKAVARRDADKMAGERARELSALAEELVAGASAVIRQSDEFLRALDQSAGTAAGNGAAAQEDGANDIQPTEGAELPISDRARLLAAQMAVAESPRDEIAQRLQEEFGIQDAGPMLDRMGI